jgi:hypothetical protein
LGVQPSRINPPVRRVRPQMDRTLTTNSLKEDRMPRGKSSERAC